MSAHGARRLSVMAENALNIVAIELLAGVQGCDFHAPMQSSAAIERARALLRQSVPRLVDDRPFAPDIAAAADLVRSGALISAIGVTFPKLEAAGP